MLVYGREGRSLLDLVYAGWVESDFEKLNLSQYAHQLADVLQGAREIAADNSSNAQCYRKKLYDRNSVRRKLEVGSLVMCRIPGLRASLTESWAGPFEITEQLNDVNQKIGGQFQI